MATFVKEFMGTSLLSAQANGSVTEARLTRKKAAPKKGTKKVVRKAPVKRGTQVKKAPKKASRGSKSNFGPGRPLWNPNAESPAWLNGTMIGDRGFDPLGLAKPAEYVQFDLDSLDQSGAINKMGAPIGNFNPGKTEVSTDSLQPYNEVFDIQRFRECELIHGRWCMLASAGALVAEAATGVSWIDAGKVQLEGAEYLGFPLPFSVSQLVIIEVLLMGYIEVARNSELDSEKRCYPGGRFDPFGLATPEALDDLKLAELKHSRLAMIAMLIFSLEAAFGDNTSPLGAIGF
mmetsp:Transcript_32226/g.38991  ORF Transcript_32226/g.38991 Transcript_32226/m.38991 type:complete len:290 (+) Transcript_32226:75-944(+)|eukprot:CAMPEP_0197845398 /NCGR_PEP_ID=MMETSP1438-20131217/2330_1 /TAXON_ID=1461541 /ORGANISM="Pterosperma sp., Strain CCMP1384" /LENGTH=289 /DNA_ID=CAMNT_0043456679 /DNA_START=77 /DNA_END=946 /DNA_ORIENTATION=+